MCGIAGIFDLTGHRSIDTRLLAKMNESLYHRGPDEGDQFVAPGVGLAHRRLSIIDLSTGQQPMSSADGNLCVVYNGEIYNFIDIRRELEKKGYTFLTKCDTEVILYAWEEWGESCVEHFRGMFAFALYDKRGQSLFLARDRLGIKPLYYSLIPDGQVIFGSELKALQQHPDIPRKLDVRAVEDYFALGYVPEPKSIYSGVGKLEPGHCILLQRGRPAPQSREYWDVPFTKIVSASENDLHSQLIDRLREAVDIRMLAEVPLGAFLSGGIDSSAVVAMMAGLHEDPVNTCSIGFNHEAFDESEFANEVALSYKTNHFSDQVDVDDFDLLDTLGAVYDEPFADSSAIPTYRVCELARKRVTVALSGDGGDENFAGYRRYQSHMREEALRRKFPESFRRHVFGALGQVYPDLYWAPKPFRGKATLQAMARSSVEAYLHEISLQSYQERKSLFSSEMLSALQGYRVNEVFDHHAGRAPTDDPLSLIQYLDMKTYLVGDILTKVDRASMAHSLEVRVPLLDHKFVEWVSSLPPSLKLHGREGKYVLKRSLEPYLSKGILYRKKMGFAVPLANWFRGPLKQRLRSSLLEGGLADTGIFNQNYLHQLVDMHQSGRRDHSAILWALLMFEQSLTRSTINGI